MPSGRRFALVSLVALAGTTAAIVVPAAPAATGPAATRPARLAVGVEVFHFAAGGKKLTATGYVTATISDGSGHSRTIHSRIALTAATGRNCRVCTCS